MLPTQKIGPLAILTGLHLAEKKIYKKKTVDLFYISGNICNSILFKIISKNLTFLSSKILRPIDNLNNFFLLFFKFPIKHKILNKRTGSDYYNIINKAKINYVLDKYDDKKAKSIFKKMGLNNKDFVCLIVRDEKFNKKNWSHISGISHNNYRNSDIKNFKLAAKALTKKGLFVLRMGRDTKKKFYIKSSKAIDYSKSNYVSNLMDIYLISKCKFMISTGTGLDSVAFIFRKPICYINSLPAGCMQNSGSQNILLTKRHFHKKKEMSLNEIFMSNVAYVDSLREYSLKNISLKDHKPVQIKDTVLEMYKRVIKKNKPLKKEIQVQKKFKKLFLKNIFKISKKYKKNNLFHEQFNPKFVNNALNNNFLANEYKISSNYSSSYLNKNQWWLN